jgi:pimeloyl-ACP methyl ester carboxylesterase
MREFWFNNEALRLFGVESGAGSPVMMLHGPMADHRVGRAFGAGVDERFRLITPDLRSGGRSPFGGRLTWDDMAADALAALDHLGVERVVMGAVSGATGAALRFAFNWPQRLAGLAIVTPVYAGADVGLEPGQSGPLMAMEEVARRAPVEGIEVLRPLYEALPEPMRAGALAMILSQDPASVAAGGRLLASGEQPFETAADLARLKMPVLFVPGNDAMHPASVSDIYLRHLPDCRTGMTIPEFCHGLAPW